MKKPLFIAISMLLLAACGKEATQEQNVMRFQFGYPGTRATATGFEANDAVSLYAVQWVGGVQYPLQIGGNYLNNEKITFDGTDWNPERTLYWADTPCDFYALYPYQAEITSIERTPFNLAADQNDGGYEASDLLFAYAENKARADGPVLLQFKHMMSKIKVNLVKGPNFEGEIPNDVVAHIYNTITSCTVNLATGSVEKDAFGARNTQRALRGRGRPAEHREADSAHRAHHGRHRLSAGDLAEFPSGLRAYYHGDAEHLTGPGTDRNLHRSGHRPVGTGLINHM